MPVKNEFFGVFKTLKVGGNFLLAETASKSREMDVSQKNYIQGTAKNRILDIGGVSENISIKAPVLIGGGSVIDGRTLLNTQIDNALKKYGVILPILKSAEISVSSEAGGMVALQMESDGAPLNSAFVLSDYPVELLEGDKNAEHFTDVLNPAHPDPRMQPTRVAKFFDFRVNMAGIYLYVTKASIKVDVETKKTYFLGGIPDPDTAAPGDPSVPPSNPYNWGTQFPWLGVAGIKISGSGEAVALLTNEGDTGDYTFDYGQTTTGGQPETTNFNNPEQDITLQTPGCTQTSGAKFAVQVYDCFDDEWHSLFLKSDGSGDLFDLSKSIISKSDFNVSAGLLTVAFNFYCWVK